MLRFTAFAQTIPWTKDECFIQDSTGAEIATLQGFECIFRNILLIIIPFAGLAAFVVLIVGGFQFLNSGGDPKAAGAARTTLTYAFLGIILVVASWLILQLVRSVTGVDVTTVNLPT